MRVLIQRVSRARVEVEGKEVASITEGLLVLVGFGQTDNAELPGSRAWNKIIDRLLNLRVFPDDEGKLNNNLKDTAGGLLLVPQFTLYADCGKGRRPSFTNACDPALAQTLFDKFVSAVRAHAPGRLNTGVFGAEMHVELVNWGPVTIWLDSADL